MLEGTLPGSIDTKRLDPGGVRFEGTVSLVAMHRLRELVLAPAGKVQAVVEVWLDKALYVTVAGTVTAQVRLVCQRCLEPKEILLQASFRLLAVGSLLEAEALAGHSDSLVAAGGVIDLLTALEDELLLALPPVTMHEGDEACSQRGFHFGAPEAKEAEPLHQSPFAGLEQLKKRGD